MTDRPAHLKPRTKLLAWGILAPGESKVVKLQKQLPDGFSPLVVNARPNKARLVLADVQASTITIHNDGIETGSFMLFAATTKAQRVIGAVGLFLQAFKTAPPKEPA